MKAKQFIEKLGWDKAKELKVFYDQCGSLTCDCDFTIDDLKQYTDAWEFVNAHGSIDNARKYVYKMDSRLDSKHYKSLMRKIELVESIEVKK